MRNISCIELKSLTTRTLEEMVEKIWSSIHFLAKRRSRATKGLPRSPPQFWISSASLTMVESPIRTNPNRSNHPPSHLLLGGSWILTLMKTMDPNRVSRKWRRKQGWVLVFFFYKRLPYWRTRLRQPQILQLPPTSIPMHATTPKKIFWSYKKIQKFLGIRAAFLGASVITG